MPQGPLCVLLLVCAVIAAPVREEWNADSLAAILGYLPIGRHIELPLSGRVVVAYPDGPNGEHAIHIDEINCEKHALWAEQLPDPPRHRVRNLRRAHPLTHVALGPPVQIGNHSPRFSLSGNVIKVREDSGPYKLGAQFAVQITDSNGDTQSVSFECTSDNPELFEKQPDIVACPINFCVGTPEVKPGTGTLVFTPRTDRFGTATVSCKAVDSGIGYPVCENMSPPCNVRPCDVPGADCNESPQVQFVIEILRVNDQPEFVHTGDVVSPEDVEQCIENWAREVTAGGWEEGPTSIHQQELYWNVKTDNPDLFKTQPYIRYQQGARTGDLCFTPADDMTGRAVAQIYLTDSGGRADGGIDDKPPETITITIIEVNDPPTFTPGPLRVAVPEDSGFTDMPWATDISPGPVAELRAKQELDKFVVELQNPAHKKLFKVLPSIDVETGHLTFEVADDANTFGIDCAMTVHLVDTATPPALPAKSLKPWPVLHIEITPVNDPPSYKPPQPNKDVTVLEGEAVQGMQWAHDVCIGKAPPTCVESEAYSGGENQKIRFELQATNMDLFAVSPVLDPTGKLSFHTAEDKHGKSVVTVVQTDSGPPPNEGPRTNFIITVLPVNDPPRFVTPSTSVVVDEDSGRVTIERFLEKVVGGPEDEYEQVVTFHASVTRPELFASPPEMRFKMQGKGPTYGDLVFTPADNAFGVTNMTFYIKDDGGVEHTRQWNVKVQKDSSGSLGWDLKGDLLDVVWVDPDGGAAKAGVRAGMRLVAIEGRHVTTLPAAWAALEVAMGEFEITVQNGTDRTYGPLVEIHIRAVNDLPTFLKGMDVTIPEDSPPGITTVLLWTHKQSPGPLESSLQYVGYNCTHTPSWGLVSPPNINHHGDLNFTLAPNFFGVINVAASIADFSLPVGSNSTPLSRWSDPQDFTITVTPVNDPPIFEHQHAPLVVDWCPPIEDHPNANCTRDIPRWAWDIAPGPANEADQQLEFEFTPGIPRDEWYALFAPHHQMAISLNDGALHFTLQRGAMPSVSEIPVTVTLRDDGGTDNGGLDSNARNFTLVIRNLTTPSPPPAYPMGVVVLTKAIWGRGSSIVVPPLFRTVDSTGRAMPCPAGTTVNITLTGPAPETWLVRADGRHSFPRDPVTLLAEGTYQFVCEVHLPDGHIITGRDDPFVLGTRGTVDVSRYRPEGVISDRPFNEWDLRTAAVRLVLTIKGDTWREIAKRAVVELHLGPTGSIRPFTALQGNSTTTGTSGEAAPLNATGLGGKVAVLESANTLDSTTQLTLSIPAYPSLNIASDALLRVRFEDGSVAGSFVPHVSVPVLAAPALRLEGGNSSEVDVRKGGVRLDMHLSGNGGWPSDGGNVVAAIEASSFQQSGFNALRDRLVSAERVSSQLMRITIGPLEEYDIGVDEVVRVYPARLRVTGGVQPDFDNSPSVFVITTYHAVLATPAPPTRESSPGHWRVAVFLSVIAALAALVASFATSPILLASPLAVAFTLRSAGAYQPSHDAWRGMFWWTQPDIARIGSDATPLVVQEAQGALVILTVVLLVLLGLHALLAYGFYRVHGGGKEPRKAPLTSMNLAERRDVDGARLSFRDCCAKVGFPNYWLLLFVPTQQVVLHNCIITIREGETMWAVVAWLLAVVSSLLVLAIHVLPYQWKERIAGYHVTDGWHLKKHQRFVLPRGVWKSFTAEDIRFSFDGSAPLLPRGVQRFGSLLASFRPSRLWLGAAIFLWLVVLNAIAAQAPGSQSTDFSLPLAIFVFDVLMLGVLLVYHPNRSRLLHWLHVFAIALVSLAALLLAIGVKQSASPVLHGGTNVALASLVAFIVLFTASLIVLFRTRKLEAEHQRSFMNRSAPPSLTGMSPQAKYTPKGHLEAPPNPITVVFEDGATTKPSLSTVPTAPWKEPPSQTSLSSSTQVISLPSESDLKHH